MFIRRSTLLLSLLFFATCALAQDDDEPRQWTLAEVQQDLDSTVRMIEAAYADDPIFLEQLSKSQQAWAAYRDAQVDLLMPPHPEGYYGNWHSRCLAGTKRTMTEVRITALNEWLIGQHEGDVCGLSMKYVDDLKTLPIERYSRPYGPEFVMERGWELMAAEKLGWLRLGATAFVTQRGLGEPEQKDGIGLCPVDGLHHQTWSYPKLGIVLEMDGEHFDAQEIGGITITAPSTYRTLRRIGIGSSKAEVQAAYSVAMETEVPGSGQLVAGTVYGGIIFAFVEDKVSAIFLGIANHD